MKIVLLRHGRPAVADFGQISGMAFQSWIDAYNHADLERDSLPSVESLAIATDCQVVVCSNLVRSIESAKLLGFAQPEWIEHDFREMDLPAGNIPLLKCHAAFWAVVFRVSWFLGYSNGVESYQQARLRVRHCAQRLIKIAQENESVMLVGHGFLNRFIGKELNALGWQGTPANHRGYWGFSVYKLPE